VHPPHIRIGQIESFSLGKIPNYITPFVSAIAGNFEVPFFVLTGQGEGANKATAQVIVDFVYQTIEPLQQTQAIFGYLPESVMHRISDALAESRSKVFGVVTFYSFFSTVPRGKHLIRVCLGTACYVLGAKEVLTAMKEELGIDVGQTTEDRLFSLDVGRCFGACGLAPILTIDEDVHKRVRPEDIPGILATVRNRQPAGQEEKA
ncbi:hypothetical protein LCGC14_3127170, partial [marine sediment metagenome]